MKKWRLLTWALGLALAASPTPRAAAQAPTKPAQVVPSPAPARTIADTEGVIIALPQTPAAAPSSSAPENSAAGEKATPPGAYVSPWLLDVIRLAEARIDDTVILTFIESAGTFNLDPDQIIHLHNLEIPAGIITTMIQHDFEIVSGQRPIPAAPSGSRPVTHLAFASNGPPAAPLASSSRIAAAEAPIEASPPAVAEEGTQARAAVVDHQESVVSARQFRGEPGMVFAETRLVSPVRRPYAVQLLDPIIMIRAGGRTPNLVVIEMPP